MQMGNANQDDPDREPRAANRKLYAQQEVICFSVHLFEAEVL
jgi:hypothetical protein